MHLKKSSAKMAAILSRGRWVKDEFRRYILYCNSSKVLGSQKLVIIDSGPDNGDPNDIFVRHRLPRSQPPLAVLWQCRYVIFLESEIWVLLYFQKNIELNIHLVEEFSLLWCDYMHQRLSIIYRSVSWHAAILTIYNDCWVHMNELFIC